MRIITIGDIHGNHKALLQVLERSNYSPSDKLVCVGDYVDGWPESDKVVDTLLNLQSQKGHSNPLNVYIKGNHDDWFMEFLEDMPHALEPNAFDNFKVKIFFNNRWGHWQKYGGKATFNAYRGKQDLALKHLDKFFRKLVLTYRFPEEWVPNQESMVWMHGGFRVPPGYDQECLIANNTNFFWDRTLNRRACHLQALVDKGHPVKEETLSIEGFKRIFIGHTQTNEYDQFEPMLMGNVVNVDQGAGWDWKLTGWIYNTETQEETFVQSDQSTKLYPNYKGRSF